MRWFMLMVSVCLFLGCNSTGSTLTESSDEEELPPGAFVAALWTEGKEVVIEPDLEKLKSHDLTAEQLEPLRHRRLDAGTWEVEIEGNKLKLTDVAKLTVRDLALGPFIVPLIDGREAVIVPDVKKIKPYKVTSDSFKNEVRQLLQGPYKENPAEIVVLNGISVPGDNVPNYWGKDHVHMSMGGPLKDFAEVEIRGEPGPQAADLAYMRSASKHLQNGVELAKGLTKEELDKKFGSGEKYIPEPMPHFDTIPSWMYKLGSGNLQVFFSQDESTIQSISANSRQFLPGISSPDKGKLARAAAETDRALLLLFLTKRFAGSTEADKKVLGDFLKNTDADLKWTDEERKQMTGEN
jgi:hypothetical protein